MIAHERIAVTCARCNSVITESARLIRAHGQGWCPNCLSLFPYNASGDAAATALAEAKAARRRRRDRIATLRQSWAEPIAKAQPRRLTDVLAAQLERNPDDHQARFDLAVKYNAEGKRLEAAEALVALMRRDRSWNEDGARKKLLELFEAWGPKDAATLKGRRLLSALLFS